MYEGATKSTSWAHECLKSFGKDSRILLFRYDIESILAVDRAQEAIRTLAMKFLACLSQAMIDEYPVSLRSSQ